MIEIRINEIFVSPQGEGPNVGRESIFVRTHGCPVRCSWCDTAYTWDGSESGRGYSPPELVRAIESASESRTVERVVFTGGEPLISLGLVEVVNALLCRGFGVEIETSAAIPLHPKWIALLRHGRRHGMAWNLSPKMPSAGPRIRPSVVRLGEYASAIGADACFKVVIHDDADWNAWAEMSAQLVAAGFGWVPVWVSPQAQTAAELMTATAWLIGKSARSGFRVSPRQQVLSFGSERRR